MADADVTTAQSHLESIGTLIRRELLAYCLSPIAYIVVGVYLLVTGILFWITGAGSGQQAPPYFFYANADLRTLFVAMPPLLSLLMSALSMKTYSDEYETGSFEILKTLPFSMTDIALGKYIALVIIGCIAVFPTMLYAVVISFWGDLDQGSVIAGYFGAFLLICTFGAIGLFFSSLTKNQIVALIVSLVVINLLNYIGQALFFMPTFFVSIADFFSTTSHFSSLSQGVIALKDVFYFLSLSFLGVFGAVLVTRAHE